MHNLHESISACKAEPFSNSNLASIHDIQTNDFLKELSGGNDNAWIGGWRLDNNEAWMWSDGSTWTGFASWAPDQPDNNDEIEALEQKLKTLKISKPQHHRRPLAQIIGIDPKLKRFYVPTDKNKFVCLDSNQEIPFDWVNDDFCDCPNGSDEPATGACQKNPFYCTTQR